MTWTGLQTLGGGVVAFRLQIERCPWQWVTHTSMQDTSAASAANPAVRYPGLVVRNAKTKGVSNPATGELEVASTACQIADIDGRATAVFGLRPSRRTYITASKTQAATSLSVLSTAGWPTTGNIWVNSECMAYSGLGGGTAFTGLTRGLLNSIAQAHYVETGGDARFPEVTNHPNTIAGARAYIYGYGEKDSPTGDGTLVWSGIVSRDPVYDGKQWSLSIEPLTSLLDRSVSADLASPVYPRGIYYPASRPFWLQFSDNGNSRTITFPTATTDTAFFETNEEFCAYLTTKIDAKFSGSGADVTIVAVADGDRSWHLEMTTGVSPHQIFVMGCGGVDPEFDGSPTNDIGDEATIPLDDATTYYWYPNGTGVSGAGSVPRGYWGVPPRSPAGPDEDTAAAFPPGRIYVGGIYDFSNLSAARVNWQALGEWEAQELVHVVASVDAGDRFIDFYRDAARLEQPFGYTAWAPPEINLGRTFASDGGNLGDMLLDLCTLTPAGVNAGSVPPLRTTDFVSLDTFPNVPDRIVNKRRYSSFGDFTLMDVVKAECLLAGYAVGLAGTGQIYFYELVPPVDNSLSAVGSIYEIQHPIVSGSLPSYDRSAKGMCNQVIVRRGYNSAEDDYTAAPAVIRDVAAFGMSPRPRTIEIALKSEQLGDTERFPECVARAAKLLAMFAMPYAIVKVQCDARQIGVWPGDTVYITSPHIPDTSTGTVGVEGLPGLVIGREFEFGSCSVSLHCFISERNTCAYVPEFFITGEVNDSGNIWTLTLDTGAHSAAWYLEIGYRVQVWQYNSATAGTVVGTVTAVTTTTATVSFDASAAAIAAGTWVLSWADVDDASLEIAQEANAYVASSTAILEANSGDTIPKEFG